MSINVVLFPIVALLKKYTEMVSEKKDTMIFFPLRLLLEFMHITEHYRKFLVSFQMDRE